MAMIKQTIKSNTEKGCGFKMAGYLFKMVDYF